jgi:uncharacterized membrane protein
MMKNRSDRNVLQPGMAPSRLQPLDLLRGLLMILMSLDHANFHIAQQHSSGEYWGGPFPVFSTSLQFLVRFVTHFSAPGFFFTLGVGMVLFASSRRNKGWNESEIQGHFVIRGFVLIALQIFLNFGQAWSVAGSRALLWYVGVLAALGFGMILCIPLLRLKPISLAGISLGLFVVMEVLTPDPLLWGKNFGHPAGTLLVYSGGRGEFWTNYPLLAWVELIVLGMLFGKWILKDTRMAYQKGAWLGLIFLVAFGLLRALNGFGNIRQLPTENWMGFLSLVKYPPSMTFVLLTMGINLILLWAFSKIKKPVFADLNPLLVFGRVPLFFYLGHIWIYLLIGRLLTPRGSDLGLMFILWLVGLFFLYLPVHWYGQYKSRQPARSWVRFL